MARNSSNKYATINFNEIYGKKSSSPSSAPPSTVHPPPVSSARTRYPSNGGMLVLTRPSKPKPQPTTVTDLRELPITVSPPITPEKPEIQPTHDAALEIRPRTKPEPFIPPHLRPGFAGEGCKVSETARPKSSGSLQSRGRTEFDGTEGTRRGAAGNRVSSNGYSSSSSYSPYDQKTRKNDF